jgi:hypothetical protein
MTKGKEFGNDVNIDSRSALKIGGQVKSCGNDKKKRIRE